jgi:hypothetical protein
MGSYPHIHTPHKERKSSKKKERVIITLQAHLSIRIDLVSLVLLEKIEK